MLVLLSNHTDSKASLRPYLSRALRGKPLDGTEDTPLGRGKRVSVPNSLFHQDDDSKSDDQGVHPIQKDNKMVSFTQLLSIKLTFEINVYRHDRAVSVCAF